VASDCCAVQRVESAGSGLRSVDEPVRPPARAALSEAIARPEPAWIGTTAVEVAIAPGEPPPRWLSAGALLL